MISAWKDFGVLSQEKVVKVVPVMLSVASISVVMHTLDNVIVSPALVVQSVTHVLKAIMDTTQMDVNVSKQFVF